MGKLFSNFGWISANFIVLDVVPINISIAILANNENLSGKFVVINVLYIFRT